ncbi:MAG: hypothetical protein Q4E28_00155 [Clostridia bacterium]|nr:hypothetical protein [Clostridia bacterium]
MKNHKLLKRVSLIILSLIISIFCILPAVAVKTTYFSFDPPEEWEEKKDVRVISEGIEDLRVFILPGEKNENFRLYVHDNMAVKSAADLNETTIKKFEEQLQETLQSSVEPGVTIKVDRINTILTKVKTHKALKTVIEQTISYEDYNFKARVVDYSIFTKNKVVHAQFALAYDSLVTSKQADDIVKKVKIRGDRLPAKASKAKKESSFDIKILLIVMVVVLLLSGITVVVIVIVKSKKD